ncbi:glycosyltransferase [Litorivicinus lipolyticus]|uniref:glycosyltransferase n=1 Tax=Litorivicinus lipolyticus TaxID=418701 RepID=UPI003B5C71A7
MNEEHAQLNRYSPTCAILLAAYNGELWIEEQLASILNQVDVQVAVFVSVDVSIDSTLEIVEQIAVKDSRVHLLPYGERFGGAGRNFYRLIKDVDVSAFDMVGFADQDDIWMPDKLSAAWKVLSQEGYAAYSSDVIAFWADGRRSLIKKSYPQKRFDYFYEAAGPGCTYVFSASAFTLIKGFVSQNYEGCGKVALHDWLIYSYCREQKQRWFIDHEPRMLYRQHASNQVGTNDNWRAYIKRFNFVKQRWYRRQVSSIATLCSSSSADFITSRSFMIRNFYELRRRPRDVVALLLMVILGLF